MSLRLEMLQVARLAPKLLGDSAELVGNFLRGQQNQDGGFKDRAGNSDLYYTVFGMDGLIALEAQTPTLAPEVCERTQLFLRSFHDGEGLDLVHLCCLARCWGALFPRRDSDKSMFVSCSKEILRRIEQFRSTDGGYNPAVGSQTGTAYGCFLALGAYQDLQGSLPGPLRLVQGLKFLETEDGAWANDRSLRVGSTTATAAAVTLLRQLNIPVSQTVGDWLLARFHPEGGFRASPDAPMPDLLSTAVAVHALAGLQVPFEHIKESCLDFVDSLWTNEGGFHGHWGDDVLDCEYTFYGLLALGHLSL
jgi:prenyltransferase beta subunit